ncbi:hypothetical protein SDC9_128243 [bioreactor metagenome]|uniref:Uncharacterized protein n=1 Tax=bioreactor metagenome TaxID=1076179 RepID=A0A645CWA7_9ZZZZ
MAGGDKNGEFIGIDGFVGRHPHNVQIDGIQCELGQDSRQNCRDAKPRVEQAGAKPRQHPGENRSQHRRPGGPAPQNQHGGHRAAGGEGAVHRQIGDVQQTKGDVHAQRHHAPDNPLRHAAGKAFQQIDRVQRSKICREFHGFLLFSVIFLGSRGMGRRHPIPPLSIPRPEAKALAPGRENRQIQDFFSPRWRYTRRGW